MSNLANHTLRAAGSLVLLCSTLSAQVSVAAQGGSEKAISAAVEVPRSTTAPDSKPHDDAFVIGAEDVLAVNVWKEPDLSRSIPVRSDGKISLPLVGEVVAAGRTPLQLEDDISTRLKSYITEPQVTVMVQQINSQKFNVLGQVERPGSYPLIANTTIVDAIAVAGGFRDFAKKKGIYVLRKDASGGESRIAFNYQDYLKGKSVSKNVALKAHDTIIVP